MIKDIINFFLFLFKDEDKVDGCEEDYSKYSVSDKEAEMLALFPSGKASKKKAREWEKLFNG